MDDLVAQLSQVLATMDTIPVVTLENQNKFLDCARRIQFVTEILKSAQKQNEEKSEVNSDG